ncbi:MAG: hypothetical protein H6730_17775 [Deltaproteobacteria bacterium]|nr:hypothetical protein [Deltaproteobacteria bacterium]
MPEPRLHTDLEPRQGLSARIRGRAQDAARRLETSFADRHLGEDVAKHGLAAMSERLRRAAEATRPPEGDDDEE